MLNAIDRYDDCHDKQSGNSQKCRSHNHNYSMLLDDLEEHPELITDNLCDFYMGNTDLSSMSYDGACDALYDIVERDPMHIKQIKRIFKKYKSYQEDCGIDVFTNSKPIPRLEFRRSDIKAWFQPLPLYLAITLYDHIVTAYMHSLGLELSSFRGIDVWTNGYDPERGNPIIFFHASVGGITMQIGPIVKYMSKFNLIMPNIPGMNFSDTGEVPMTLTAVAKRMRDFVRTAYSSDFNYDDRCVDLMGHSIGNSYCCATINRYPEFARRFFCVEGQIFFHRSMKVYAEFETDPLTLPIADILSYPLLHRDMYAQFMIQRCVKANEVFIHEIGDLDVYMFHTETDKKFLINAQLKYADVKELPVYYHIYKKKTRKSHGAFVLDKPFRDYVYNEMCRITDKN